MKKKINKKEVRQALFFSIFLGVLTLGLIGFLIFSDIRITQKRNQLLDKINSLNKQIQVLEEKNTELKDNISEVDKDAHWEEKIREQGYQKPGESAVVVLPPEEKTSVTEPPKNIWQKLLNKIGL